ncbi:hypothetical protein BDR04DRAFT_1163479 [Suillus decipiens]|nr:hypothetical protein BDR04DRAFT_1163479 [Suillus decipiens]
MARTRANCFGHPIIVARVFKSHLEKVLHVLQTSFGMKKYMIKVIEFQKQGFPHAHIIIKVEPEPPLEFLNTIICAELP